MLDGADVEDVVGVLLLVVKAVMNHSGYLVEGVESLCVDSCTGSGVVVEAMYTGDGLWV